MARAVRKVSRVSTKNQKKEGLNKKLIAIISAIAVVIIGVAVGLIVYFTTQEEELYVSEKVYFVEETYGTKQDKGSVTFAKESYFNIVRRIQKDDIQNPIEEHVFIFAYDGSQFYGDMEYVEQFEDDEYKTQLEIYNEYTKLITYVADLQIAVNEAVSKGHEVALYVIDISVDNGVNAGVMLDSADLHEKDFAPLYSSVDGEVEPALFYLHEGVVKGRYDDKSVATAKTVRTLLSIAIPNAIRHLVNLPQEQ